MPFLSFLGKLALVLLLLFFAVSPFVFEDFFAFWSTVQQFSKGLFETILLLFSFFRHADVWNYFFVLFFIASFLLGFSLIDILISNRLKWKFKYPDLFYLSKFLPAIVAVILFAIISNILVIANTAPKINWNTEHLPDGKRDILLLGTNKQLASGDSNAYFYARIDAAYELYKKGLVNRVVISGDNSRTDYNEPLDMKKVLVQAGIPSSIIKLDFAGFRTLDSIVRFKQLFGANGVIIISQSFHLSRALFLSDFYNIDALGYAASGGATLKMRAREFLAKNKVILDLFFFNMQPKKGKTLARRPFDWSASIDWFLVVLLLSFLYLAFRTVHKTMRFV